MRSFRLVARLRVTTHPVVRGVADKAFYRGIANYAMITMGGRMRHFEAVIPEDGVLEIDHTFEAIADGESYLNQMGWHGQVSDAMRAQGIAYDDQDDLRIKSHCIVWLFRRRMQRRRDAQPKPGDFVEVQPRGERFDRVADGYAAPVDLERPLAIDEEDLAFQVPGGHESPLSPVLRCYLIGAEAIDLAAVCEATIRASRPPAPSMGAEVEGGGEGGGQTPPSFPVHHNFCETHATCEILGIQSEGDVESLASATRELRVEVQRYKDEEALAAREGRAPDHSEHRYMQSALADIARCNEIVRLQQRLMQYGAILKLRRGELELSDEMGAAFLSGSTFLQLHGMAACFTDMSDIVRAVAAEIPFRLLLSHARAAMLVNGLTPAEVCGMRPDAPGAHERLFAVYLSTLTCEMMDQRQAGYYSDYCLHGVEACDEGDYDSDRQPGPRDVGCDGEAWFYRIYRPPNGGGVVHVRYRLRLTEDQRQVCTGRGLRYGVINDDCETSASFAMAENKTAACLRAHMMRHGFIDDGDAGPHAQSRDERFESLLQDLLAFVATKTGREDIQDKVGVIAGALGLGGAGGVTREGVELFMAAANILRQFDLRMELCIGTANAAAVGAAAQLSGHCYGMCIAYHHLSRQLLAMIVEGTRWVLQEQCRPEGERLMTDGQGNMLNALSSLLMEMTKLPGLAPYRDAGCGLMRVMRQAGVPETFYKSIYVVGDGVVVQRRGGGSSHVVVGAPVDRVLRMRAGGPDDSGTGEIKVKYALVCREIEARCRRRVRPAAIGEAVVRMARETTVPAWSREHWARVIGKDGDDTMVYEADDTSEALSPEGMVRFAFTHQLYAPLTGEQRHRFKKEILRAVQEGHEGISRQHLVRIYGEGTGVGPTIDDGVRRAHAALATLPGKVVVERVFTAGGIVVAVCLIRPSDIATAHAACMNWAKVIIDAREAAEAGLAGRRPGEEPVGDIEVVAAE